MLFGSFCEKKSEFVSVFALHFLQGDCYGEGDPKVPEV